MTDSESQTSTVDIPRVWTRLGDRTPQDDDGALPFDDLHLHRYCAVYPFVPDDDGMLHERRAERGGEAIEITFVGGLTREALRHTPMVVLLLTVVFFGSAEVMPGVQGISVFFPPISTVEVTILAGVGTLYAGLTGLLVSVGLLDGEQIYRALVVYGLLTVLLVGTLASVALVLLNDPRELPPNIVFTSGYLLMLLLTGMLVFDGMIRTEHMFEHLDTLDIVTDVEEFQLFKRRLRDNLAHAVPAGEWWPFRRVPAATVFGVLFVSQFLVLWTVGQGPQNLDFPVTVALNVAIDVFIAIIAFQFLVLIKVFYELVTLDLKTDVSSLRELDGVETPSTDASTDDPESGGADEAAASTDGDSAPHVLGYEIDHPDGYAGYFELGKFASRVNVLLIIAGFYLVYRLYVHSKRIPAEAMAPGFEPTIGMAVWFMSFVVPIVAYALATAAWLYYSFWHLHLRMIREREREWEREETEKQDLQRRDLAPAWPVNPNQIMSIVSGAVTPVVVTLFKLF